MNEKKKPKQTVKKEYLTNANENKKRTKLHDGEKKIVNDLFRRRTCLMKNPFFTIARGPKKKHTHEIYLTHRKNDVKQQRLKKKVQP